MLYTMAYNHIRLLSNHEWYLNGQLLLGWHTPVISALGRSRQEDWHEFWATEQVSRQPGLYRTAPRLKQTVSNSFAKTGLHAMHRGEAETSYRLHVSVLIRASARGHDVSQHLNLLNLPACPLLHAFPRQAPFDPKSCSRGLPPTSNHDPVRSSCGQCCPLNESDFSSTLSFTTL